MPIDTTFDSSDWTLEVMGDINNAPDTKTTWGITGHVNRTEAGSFVITGNGGENELIICPNALWKDKDHAFRTSLTVIHTRMLQPPQIWQTVINGGTQVAMEATFELALEGLVARELEGSKDTVQVVIWETR